MTDKYVEELYESIFHTEVESARQELEGIMQRVATFVDKKVEEAVRIAAIMNTRFGLKPILKAKTPDRDFMDIESVEEQFTQDLRSLLKFPKCIRSTLRLESAQVHGLNVWHPSQLIRYELTQNILVVRRVSGDSFVSESYNINNTGMDDLLEEDFDRGCIHKSFMIDEKIILFERSSVWNLYTATLEFDEETKTCNVTYSRTELPSPILSCARRSDNEFELISGGTKIPEHRRIRFENRVLEVRSFCSLSPGILFELDPTQDYTYIRWGSVREVFKVGSKVPLHVYETVSGQCGGVTLKENNYVVFGMETTLVIGGFCAETLNTTGSLNSGGFLLGKHLVIESPAYTYVLKLHPKLL